jgi:hypothetical protein
MIPNAAALRYFAAVTNVSIQAAKLCDGLPCIIHPDLLFRAEQPAWLIGSHVHPIYYAWERHAGMRWVLITLAPDHLSDLRDQLTLSKLPTIALTPGGLPALVYRCLLTTYAQAYRPFNTSAQNTPAICMRALALADIGCVELTAEARRAYENHQPFSACRARANAQGMPTSIKEALSQTRYILKKRPPRPVGPPDPELLPAIALACALALRQLDIDTLPHLSKLVPGYRLIPLSRLGVKSTTKLFSE